MRLPKSNDRNFMQVGNAVTQTAQVMLTIGNSLPLGARRSITCAIMLAMSLCFSFRSYGNEGKKKLERAEKLYSSGKWPEAIEAFRGVLQSNPNLPEAHSHLAKAFEATNQDEAAVAEYGEAVRLNPKNGWYHFDLGSELARTGNEILAAQEFQTAVDLDPEDRETFKLMYQGLMEEVEFERRIGRRVPIFQVDGDIVTPTPIYKPEPPYTVVARHEKYQGTVVVLATINAQGDVVAVRLKRP
ncbi:MAG: tetratricopeptide repeat protein, partial [Deltaproteobacteria bacterium]